MTPKGTPASASGRDWEDWAATVVSARPARRCSRLSPTQTIGNRPARQAAFTLAGTDAPRSRVRVVGADFDGGTGERAGHALDQSGGRTDDDASRIRLRLEPRSHG